MSHPKFDEISIYCISFSSLGAYLIVVDLMSPLLFRVLRDQCEMLPKFHRI